MTVNCDLDKTAVCSLFRDRTDFRESTL